jgi:AcrR family transcriptional regulator
VATAGRRATQRRQRGETRALIVAAAEEALRTRRFREVNVEDVMEAAGLTRTIFYRHFDDLFDLVVSVARPAFQDLFALQEGILDEPGSDPERLRKALGPAVALFAEHGPLVRAVAEAAIFDDQVELLYRAALDRFTVRTARFLEQARGRPAAELQGTARALTLMNVAYLLDCFGEEHRATPEEAVTTIVGMWSAVAGRRPAP